MKKSLSVVMVILGLTVLSCGGGGGSGGGSSSSQAIDALDYFLRDTTKSYTFQETQTATANGQTVSSTITKGFSYELVDSIPSGYGDFADYPGPYRLEIVSKDGVDSELTYTDSSHNIVLEADVSSFNRIYDNTFSGSGIPSQAVLGQSYSSTARKSIYNADLDAGFWGEELGFSVVTSVQKLMAVEQVIVPAGTFSALKVQATDTITNTIEGQTSSTVYTGHRWYSEDQGLIKFSLSFSVSANGLTVEYTITDELASVSD